MSESRKFPITNIFSEKKSMASQSVPSKQTPCYQYRMKDNSLCDISTIEILGADMSHSEINQRFNIFVYPDTPASQPKRLHIKNLASSKQNETYTYTIEGAFADVFLTITPKKNILSLNFATDSINMQIKFYLVADDVLQKQIANTPTKDVSIEAVTPEKYGKENAFLKAVSAGEDDAAKTLVEQGANIHAQSFSGMTALHYLAIREKDVATKKAREKPLALAKLLLEKKADARTVNMADARPADLARLSRGGYAAGIRKLFCRSTAATDVEHCIHKILMSSESLPQYYFLEFKEDLSHQEKRWAQDGIEITLNSLDVEDAIRAIRAGKVDKAFGICIIITPDHQENALFHKTIQDAILKLVRIEKFGVNKGISSFVEDGLDDYFPRSLDF